MTDRIELQDIYRRRFRANLEYRRQVWEILIRDFFQQFISPGDKVLDLGCGYGEFINALEAADKYAMDLNPDAGSYLQPSVRLLAHDCSLPWPVESNFLNLIFSSNFFEHLPTKKKLAATLAEAYRCLAPGSALIAMGPNIRYLPDKYWDFWDHYLPLSHLSLSEGLRNAGFEITRCLPRFLPYTMSAPRKYPLALLKLYLRLPIARRLFGRQFLLVANKR